MSKQAERRNASGAVPEADLIDMAEAIAMLKTSRPTFYRWLRSGKFKGMKVGRQWRFYRKDIEAFLEGAGPRIELAADITPLMSELGRRLREAGVDWLERGDTDPVDHVAQQIIVLAAFQNASDVHIAGYMCDTSFETIGMLRLRIDGCLHVVARFDVRLVPPVVARFKRLAGCDVHETKLPQDGRILLTLKRGPGGKADTTLDLRVAALPSMLCESLTVRLLNRKTGILKLCDLPYLEHDRKRIGAALAAPNGLVLCTGPLGSGKTTTLYACLQEVGGPGRKVVTVEDPVEYVLPWATQVAVAVQQGLTFASVLRAFLRADSDVVMIGEIRDKETLQIAVQAVLTGHLVLSALHTHDAVSALVRQVDIGVSPYLIADCTRLIIAQRLVRKLCDACAVPYKPAPEDIRGAAAWLAKGQKNPLTAAKGCRVAAGCPKCAMTGYRGRTVIAETLVMSPEIGRALRAGEPPQRLHEIACSQGMVPMAANGLMRVAAGETTLAELRGYLSS